MTSSQSTEYPSDFILQNILDAILIVDRKGMIVYANKAAGRLFNRNAKELISQNFGYPVIPYEEQEIQIFRNGKVSIAQMLANEISWNNEPCFLMSLRDITVLKNMEMALMDERKKLEIANLENEQYASLASHDLKEPIRKILIYSDVLMNEIQRCGDDQLIQRVIKINESAKRMKALMSGIAEFSRISHQDGAFVNTDLNKVLEDVITDLELAIKEKSVKVTIDPLPVIPALPVQMYQLFLNLVSNAIKYSRSNVTPHIQVLKSRENDEMVEINIRDNGMGFDNQYVQRIFRPFARLHSGQYDGSGIGLAICKKIVEAHGGSINASSSPGVGSDFIIRLHKFHESE